MIVGFQISVGLPRQEASCIDPKLRAEPGGTATGKWRRVPSYQELPLAAHTSHPQPHLEPSHTTENVVSSLTWEVCNGVTQWRGDPHHRVEAGQLAISISLCPCLSIFVALSYLCALTPSPTFYVLDALLPTPEHPPPYYPTLQRHAQPVPPPPPAMRTPAGRACARTTSFQGCHGRESSLTGRPGPGRHCDSTVKRDSFQKIVLKPCYMSVRADKTVLVFSFFIFSISSSLTSHKRRMIIFPTWRHKPPGQHWKDTS